MRRGLVDLSGMARFAYPMANPSPRRGNCCRPSTMGELFTALAFVNANDMVFAGIEQGTGCGSKALALWTHTKFELRLLQQLLFSFHHPFASYHRLPRPCQCR
jgi:hypothetical protein